MCRRTEAGTVFNSRLKMLTAFLFFKKDDKNIVRFRGIDVIFVASPQRC